MTIPSKIPFRVLTLFFAASWVLSLLLTPPERSLGALIRWIFAHGTLTQAAVYLFLAAALMAAGYLLGNPRLYAWMTTVAVIAFIWWAAGFVISMVPARIAWGVFVDLNEPRTQMTLRVLAVGAIFLAVAWWVNQPKFTAIAILLFAFILLFLVRTTGLIRHPANPVGESSSQVLPLFYLAALVSAVLGGLAVSGWWVEHARQDKEGR
ncbi:MAG TPA: hypothetical protein ENK60_04535 [Anaerolineae bacterium]|nr:hypothetical protein [Anaerolineae bacterium]